MILRSRHRRSSTPPLPPHATVPLQRPTVYQKSDLKKGNSWLNFPIYRMDLSISLL
ncbi:hypothetical protein Hanom_Chr17g01567131 [Helianthus anomalus]